MSVDPTPKEYADNLIGKMYLHTFSRVLPNDGFDTAKVCALVCVDELIEQAEMGYDYDAEAELPFFKEVRKEILAAKP